MSGWSDLAFINVTNTEYPSRLNCSIYMIESYTTPDFAGVGVSPVYEAAWPAIVACCPKDQISIRSTSSRVRNNETEHGCQAWCLTTQDSLGVVNKCYQAYKAEYNSTKPPEKNVLSVIDCLDQGTKACSGAVVRPSSTSATVQTTATSVPSSTSTGMAVTAKISVRSITALVLRMSVIAITA